MGWNGSVLECERLAAGQEACWPEVFVGAVFRGLVSYPGGWLLKE